jgi:hypothetical protein
MRAKSAARLRKFPLEDRDGKGRHWVTFRFVDLRKQVRTSMPARACGEIVEGADHSVHS